MGPFTAATRYDILVLLVHLTALLVTARLLGEVTVKLGLPPVIGEILAGIVLGPSLLSGFVPPLAPWLPPPAPVQWALLEIVGLLGAMFLLLITGLETDLALIRRHARTAFGVSLVGILTTFLSGFALGMYLPDSLLGIPSARIVFALFVATAMSISAIPVIAKVLMDLQLMRRDDIGQTIIAAGMSDDTIGWILLSVVAGLASGAGFSGLHVLQSFGFVLIFMAVSFTGGRWPAKKTLGLVQDRLSSPYRMVTFVVLFMLAWGP